MALKPDRKATRALEALNFFVADFQAGIGPFLGVFLAAHGWANGGIGTVMTLGGVAGMIATAPAGAWVDATKRKRTLVAVPAVLTILASMIVLASQRFWLVAASQVATAFAGAAIIPAVAGITLGMVRQEGFGRQNGRNQAMNHAGNVAGAALSGLLGWKLGMPAVFWLAAGFGVFAIASVAMIPSGAIDHDVARGLDDSSPKEGASGFRILLQNRPLVVLAISLLTFHLGNASMLPLLGLSMVADKQGDPAGLVAITIVVAQTVMIGASLVAMRFTTRRDYWIVLLISFAALPIRGAVAATLHTAWAVYPVQALDGIGAGLQSVAVPGLVAMVLRGTGRVNVGQGAVMTAQGIGAALSPALGGWLSQGFGYPLAFGTLGSISIISIVAWLTFRRSLLSDTSDRSSSAPIPGRLQPSGSP